MKKIIAALILIVIAGLGCGSKSEDNSAMLIYLSYANNKYAGSWSGPWTDITNGQSGTATVAVTTMGAITGTINNTTTGETATISSGSISNAGSASMTYTYPSPGTSAGTYTASGTLSTQDISVSTYLYGTLTVYQGATKVADISLILTKQ